jgi:hypothetical protein
MTNGMGEKPAKALRDALESAGFGQYLRDSVEEALHSTDRKSIVANDEEFRLIFRAEACGVQVPVSILTWNMDKMDQEIQNGNLDGAHAALVAAMQEFGLSDEEENTRVICNASFLGTPYGMSVEEWRTLAQQEYDSRTKKQECRRVLEQIISCAMEMSVGARAGDILGHKGASGKTLLEDVADAVMADAVFAADGSFTYSHDDIHLALGNALSAQLLVPEPSRDIPEEEPAIKDAPEFTLEELLEAERARVCMSPEDAQVRDAVCAALGKAIEDREKVPLEVFAEQEAIFRLNRMWDEVLDALGDDPSGEAVSCLENLAKENLADYLLYDENALNYGGMDAVIGECIDDVAKEFPPEKEQEEDIRD